MTIGKRNHRHSLVWSTLLVSALLHVLAMAAIGTPSIFLIAPAKQYRTVAPSFSQVLWLAPAPAVSQLPPGRDSFTRPQAQPLPVPIKQLGLAARHSASIAVRPTAKVLTQPQANAMDLPQTDSANTILPEMTSALSAIVAGAPLPQESGNDAEQVGRGAPVPVQHARPEYAHNPAPDYPMILREQGIGGTVWLRVWVERDGRPGEIRITHGSGVRLLDEAATHAVRDWRFVPARQGEQQIASWVEFPIRFTLKG